MRKTLTVLTAVLVLSAPVARAAPRSAGHGDGEMDARAIRNAERDLERLDRSIERGMRRIERMVDDVQDHLDEKEAALADLREAREATLSFIRDSRRYYKDGQHPVGQREVNERTERVRDLHERVAPAVDRDVRRLLRLSSGDAAGLLEEIEGLFARRTELRESLEDAGRSVDEPPARLTPFARAALLARSGEEWDLEPDSAWVRAVLRRLANTAALEHNQRIARGWVPEEQDDGSRPREAEVEEIRITNEYRMVLGLRALRIDLRLVASAQGHSEEMRSMGYFGHESPVTSRRTVSMRCDEEGYPIEVSGVGENICHGYRGPWNAHEGWLESPGHHRNIVDDMWRSIGAGQAGDIWTQNFGTD